MGLGSRLKLKHIEFFLGLDILYILYASYFSFDGMMKVLDE